MPITYRFKQRQAQLEKPFQKNILKTLWKNKVKNHIKNKKSSSSKLDFYLLSKESILKIKHCAIDIKFIVFGI